MNRHPFSLSLAAAALVAAAPLTGAQDTPPVTTETSPAVAPGGETAASPSDATTTTNTGATPAAPAGPEDKVLAEARREIARLNAERDRLATENAIAKERLARELADRRAELERLKVKDEEDKARLARDLEAARSRAERDMAELKIENDRLALEMSIAKNKAELTANELRRQEAEAKADAAMLTIGMERREKELAATLYASAQPVYADNPLDGRTLTISDRRIALNGPIVARTADEVAERIDFYNNRDSRYPIFIVIDNSPGGSVMAGYKILKAMEGSKAPVYVVVKSFAASMAACIATLADKSFAYPNSVILHHQIAGLAYGNLTEQRESLKEIEQWWERLAGPIAAKMGISTEEFIKRMYERVSSGDWTEFGDKACELKWVDEIVDEIRESGQLRHPDLPSATPRPAPAQPIVIPGLAGGLHGAVEVPVLTESLDEKGRPFYMLPRANPKDVYYLYNPDGYYRVP